MVIEMRPIDADALLYDIHNAMCADCKDECAACQWRDAIKLIENVPTIGGWISVKDRLPRLGETVLFTGKSSYGTQFRTQRGWYDGTFWYRDAGETVYSNTPVTHWMPLHEPPKEDNNG